MLPLRPILSILLLWGLVPMASRAFEAVTLQADELEAPGWRARAIGARLELPGGERAQASLAIGSITRIADGQQVESVSVVCPVVVVREPRFACRGARVKARHRTLGPLALRGDAELRSDRGVLDFSGGELALAGAALSFSGSGDARGWSLSGEGGWRLPALRSLAAPWVKLPESFSLDGSADARFTARGRFAQRRRPAAARLEAELRIGALDLANEDGTIATEKVEANASVTLELGAQPLPLELRLTSAAGQALAGPVLLDLKANPVTLAARGRLRGERLELEEARLEGIGLLRAKGSGVLQMRGSPHVAQAHVAIESLSFPAAYTSFLQLPLAATDFGALRSSGRAAGELTVENDALGRVDARIEDLDLKDTRGRFFLDDLNGELHWKAGDGPLAPSWLQWSSGGAYGLSGAAARVDFEARGAGFALTRPARLPVFDGAIAVSALAVRRFGSPDAELDFEAEIEPISMPQLSRAFGWPELAGRLAGRIPALSYRNEVLTVGGDLVAQVFGGQIVGSNFRLQGPLGPWPRLFADVRARDLDLGLVTRTFPIGTITGRLEGHLLGLELFAWSPVAFDALLRTPEGDRSPHRISARAVGNLSNIGGGGGGVVQALQSGVLQFFDEYRYDEIGIRCRLRDEVCLMGGIEPAGIGYYIVKGRGLPRIDIIGNAGRVNWPQLVSQVVAAMEAEGLTVR